MTQHISELDTPALVIDLDIMERNLAKVADYARAHNFRLRPHTKTHKSPLLARKQLDLGAAGITVAKVGEAEVMLNARPGEMLVAYPVIGERKLGRLMDVARHTTVTVSLDNETAARQLSQAAASAGVTVGVLAEADVGLGRVGVPPDDIAPLAKLLSGLPGLRFRGIAFYPGHIKQMDDTGSAALHQVSAVVESMIADLRRQGLEVEIVSGGSTPTLWHSHCVKGMNEIRPGTYIFNDKNTVATGACTLADCAASILVTVVSTSVRNQFIVDGGSKTFSSDRLTGSTEPSFGYVVEAPETVFSKMNEEHGYMELRDAASRFKPGDRVRVIPNHICVAVNLHETVYGIRGERVETSWKVEARGKLQ